MDYRQIVFVNKVWVRRIILFLLFFGLILRSTAQDKNQKDSIFLQILYMDLYDSINRIPISESISKAKNIIALTERMGERSLSTRQVADEIKHKTHLELMYLHFMEQNYDSTRHYHSKIEGLCTDLNILGLANVYRYRAEEFSENYDDAIEQLNTAIDRFNESGNINREIFALLDLYSFYMVANNFEFAREVDSIVSTRLGEGKTQDRFKQKYLIKHAMLLDAEGKPEESLSYFNMVNTDSIINEPSSWKIYHGLKSMVYLKLNQPENALKCAHKTYEDPIITRKRDLPYKLSVLAHVYFKMGDYKKALSYINNCKSDPECTVPNDAFDFYYISSEIHKKLGNYKEAYQDLKKHVTILDTLKKVNLAAKTAALNFKLKKQEKLHQLNVVNMEQQTINHKLSVVIICIIFLMMFTVAVIYFFYHKNNLKTRLALDYEKRNSILKNTFIENLSHEFRTPITIIQGYIDLFKTYSFLNTQQKDYLDIISRNTSEMVFFLDNFLTISKIDSKSTQNKHVSKKIGVYLKDLVEEFKGIAITKQLGLYYKSNIDETILLSFDYDNLKKVVHNLVSNSIKYTNPNNSIYVSTSISKGFLGITVEDEGIGIEEKELPNIFNRFYQSEQNKIYGGFGIGLSLAKELITEWNGTIDVQSSLGKGSTFTVKVPLDNQAKNFKDYKKTNTFLCFTQNLNGSLKQKTDSKFPKALILEDHLEMSYYLNQILSSFLDCSSTYNGKEALEMVSKQQFDLIISDLRVPFLDGFEFKKELNKLENYKNIPFLLITASPIQLMEQKVMTLGINDYLVKPFSEIEITTRTKHLLQNKVSIKNVLKIDDSDLNFEENLMDFLQKVNSIVLTNIKNPDFNVKELSKLCAYSESQLNRVLKANTGLTAGKIILEIKLLSAYEHIKKQHFQTLNEVMFEVGINSRAYFNKSFFERFGIRPGEMFKSIKSKTL